MELLAAVTAAVTAAVAVATVLTVGAWASVTVVVTGPGLNRLLITFSVAVAILLHGPGPNLILVADRILVLVFGPGPGLSLVAGWLMQLGLSPNLLHCLVARPVLDLRAKLVLKLSRFAVVLDLGLYLELHLLSGAITGAVCFWSWPVAAPGSHRHRCGAKNQHGCQSHHCQSHFHSSTSFASTRSIGHRDEGATGVRMKM
jgi:hypothetical protein